MNPTPTISVITVVMNAERDLLQTIRSVEAQTWPHVEYVVVDGVSKKDRTLDVIREYAEKGVIHRWVSEPDKGFYDAMDKGVRLSTGDYVCFINAGDELYEPTTLEKMFGTDGDTYDVYYGDTVLTDADYRIIGPRSHKKLPENLTWKSFRWGSVVCHQAIYVRRSIAPPYDLNFPRSGDIEWSIRALKQAKNAKNVGFVIARYLRGGLSDQHRWRYMRERFWIGVRHFGFFRTLWDNFVLVFWFVIGKPL
jgi:glycosyltransferase involved in cell wall biosynthesis